MRKETGMKAAMLCLAMMGLLCFVGSGARAQVERPVKKRFLLNNDGTNLFWRDDLTMDMVARHVDECPDEITTYLLCPNGIQKLMYPSAIEDLTPMPALQRLVEAGEDPFGAFLARAKQRGFEVFVTFRMNEIHNVHTPEDARLSAFWRAHPELRVDRGAKPAYWMSQCLDYSMSAVRSRVLSLLREIVVKYDIDGIELDWMRFPRHLGGDDDEVWRKRHYLTGFMQSVREMTCARGRARMCARGRARMCAREDPVEMAVRIPTSLAGCRNIGIDIAEWHRRGLMDFVTLAAFLSTDFAVPVGEFRQAFRDYPIPIYTCIEFGFAGWDKEQRSHSDTSIRSAAMGLYDCGSDGIYVFNFPCWREYQDDPPFDWLPQLSAPELLKGKDLLFPLITMLHRQPMDLPTPLPADLPVGGTHAFVLRLPALALAEDNRPSSAELIVEPADIVPPVINGVQLSKMILKPGSPAAEFPIPPEALRPGENHIALSNAAKEPAQVTRLDLELHYRVHE